MRSRTVSLSGLGTLNDPLIDPFLLLTEHGLFRIELEVLAGDFAPSSMYLITSSSEKEDLLETGCFVSGNRTPIAISRSVEICPPSKPTSLTAKYNYTLNGIREL